MNRSKNYKDFPFFMSLKMIHNHNCRVICNNSNKREKESLMIPN